MSPVEIIEKKRDGKKLSRAEIAFLMQGIVDGSIPDYQAAAWCMATYFRGLDEEETYALTEAMVNSGSTIDLSPISRPTVDKHSTGGVGDKTSLVLVPILAACGAAVAKMSGRGLGHTGGTLDKLESIPGLRTDLDQAQFLAQVERIGLAIVSQSATLVPADKKLYALRDVTGTVPSLPLIAASIMSKKLAAGAGTIFLDIKYGSGALLPDPVRGRELARLMKGLGEAAGKKVSYCLSSMDQPLGEAIGNALEVKETLAVLTGGGPPDLRELCLALAAEILRRTNLAFDVTEGWGMAARALADGSAWAKFRDLVEAQGGQAGILEHPEKLPAAKAITALPSRRAGYLAGIDTAGLGRVAMRLGAGRTTKEDRVDPAAGVIFRLKIGDRAEKGSILAELHTSRLAELEPAQEEILACLRWSDEPVDPVPLFLVPPTSS